MALSRRGGGGRVEKEIGSSRVDRRSRREAAASGGRKNMTGPLPSAGLDRILNRKLDVVGRTRGLSKL